LWIKVMSLIHQNYFTEDVKTGYPLTKYSIRPFSDFDLTNDVEEAAERKIWNQKLSGLRVAVEDAFGRWKGRFPVLRQFPGRKIKEMYHLIEGLMIIHNILEEFRDDPTAIAGFNGLEDADVLQEYRRLDGPRRMLDTDELYWTGLAWRKRLLELSQQI
jgi:hypothetical protein